MKLVRTGLLGAALAGALSQAAYACSPPVPVIGSPPIPPPGASPADSQALATTWNIVDRAKRQVAERDATIARQAALFDGAASVVLARIDTVGRSSGAPPEFSHLNGLAYVLLKPVRWIKGEGAMETFQLGWNGMTSCGPTPEFDAIRGEAGGVYLVYLQGNALQQTDVTSTLAIDRIVEARTLAALNAALATPAPQ